MQGYAGTNVPEDGPLEAFCLPCFDCYDFSRLECKKNMTDNDTKDSLEHSLFSSRAIV